MVRFIPIFILISFAAGRNEVNSEVHRTRADHRDLQIVKSLMKTIKERWQQVADSAWPRAFMYKRHNADFAASFD